MKIDCRGSFPLVRRRVFAGRFRVEHFYEGDDVAEVLHAVEQSNLTAGQLCRHRFLRTLRTLNIIQSHRKVKRLRSYVNHDGKPIIFTRTRVGYLKYPRWVGQGRWSKTIIITFQYSFVRSELYFTSIIEVDLVNNKKKKNT